MPRGRDGDPGEPLHRSPPLARPLPGPKRTDTLLLRLYARMSAAEPDGKALRRARAQVRWEQAVGLLTVRPVMAR